MIQRHFTTTFTVKRMVWTGNTSADTTLGTFKGHIQQASAEYAEQLRSAYGVTHSVWCAKGTDVKTGDTLVIATGDYAGTYNVRNIIVHAVGHNQHFELTAIKDL